MSSRPTRTVLLVIFCASLAWALWLTIFGGVDTTIAGVRLRSNQPNRVLLVAALALVGYFIAGGRVRVAPALRGLRAMGEMASRRLIWMAWTIAIVATIVAWMHSTRIAGGADAYGYLSQAELWLNGELKIPQPWADQVPWPNAAWTFSPLGYRPADGASTLVPTYSPGLPMLMALAKLIAGHCAVFAIVPLSLGLATLATYGIGARLGSRLAGLLAAAFLATSPVVLEVALESLTDVPAMTAWSIAFYVLLGQRRWQPIVAGLVASVAILIRPNLVPLALPMMAWYLIRRSSGSAAWSSRLVDAASFVGGLIPGVAATALINSFLYGSPTTSGYGTVSGIFSIVHVWPNLQRFVTWIVQTQSVLAIVGLAALVVPWRRVWPGVTDRRVFLVIGAYVFLLWAQYSAYLEFDSAGYLRFLLASWPFMLLGVAAAMLAVANGIGRSGRVLAIAASIVLCVWQVQVAVRRDVFAQQQAAQHEVPLSRLVRSHTDERSVILAITRSGSLRYYAGRITLRYDALDPAWLDRAIEWLSARGMRTFALVDERETAEIRTRFSGQRSLAALAHPILVYEPAGTSLFDLTDASAVVVPVVIRDRQPRGGHCDPPVDAPTLTLR